MAAQRTLTSSEEVVNTLTPGEQGEFRKIDPTDSEGLTRFFNAAEASHPDIKIARGLVQQELLTFQAQQQTAPQTTQNQQQKKAGLGSTLIAAALSPLEKDTSKRGEITQDLNAEESAKLFEEGGLLDRAIQSGSEEDIQAALARIDADRLLDEEVDLLADHVTTAGGDGEAIKKKHEEQNKPNTNPRKEKKRQKKLQEKNQQREKDREQRKKELSQAKTAKDRRRLLTRYIQQDQILNTGQLQELVYQERRIFGRRSIFSKPVLQALRENQKLKLKELEEQQKEETEANGRQPIPDQFIPEPMPQPSQEFQEQEDNQDNQDDQGGGPSLPRLPKNLPTEPPVGGLAGGAGEAAAGGTGGLAAAAPYIAIGVGIIILIIVVVYVLTHLQDNPLPQLTRLNCGYYDSYIVSLGTTTQIGKSFNQQFGPMLLGDQQNPQDSNAINAEKQFFNDVCTLFGGVDIQQYPDPTKPYEFNTFGNLVDGSVNQRKGGGPSLLHFQFRFLIKDGTPCSISYDGKNNQIVTWKFHSPETCTSGQFDFLAGKVLAFSLILQQNYLHASNVFASFNTTSGPTPDPGGQIGQGLLPTNDCENGKDYGQNSGNPQNVDCFGDMVGAYISYPFYFDAPVKPTPSVSPIPTKAIIPTPTAIPSPSQADNPLLTYPTGDYAHYYTFAKYQLFDGQDIITQPKQGQVGCAIPLHASNPTDIEKAIETTFNIKVIGDVDTAKLTQVYNTLCIVLTPSIDGKPIQSTYKTLLDKATPVAINIDTINYSCVTGYTQVISDSSNLCAQSGTKANCSTMGWCSDPNWGVAANRFTLVHELTHLVRAYNQQIDTVFNTHYKLDGRLLPTDNCQLAGTKGFGSNPESECLSDLAGEYVTYLSYKHTATTRNPKITFPELADPKGLYATWYDFAKTSLFGGVEYGVSDSAASYADSLAKAIIGACPDPKGGKLLYGLPYGVVNVGDIGCLNKISSTFSAAIPELLVSAENITYNGGNLQCVGFVHAVAAGVGKPISDGSGDAKDHAHAFPGYSWTPAPPSANVTANGYLASHSLQPGDIVVWGHNFNHIAYVVGVNDNGKTINSFMVAEANGGGEHPGTVFTQKWYGIDDHISGWLRAK